MLTATLAEKCFKDLERAYLNADRADAIEIRWDYLKDFHLKKAQIFRKNIRKPVIFTFRDPPNWEILIALSDFRPDFFDLEVHTPLEVQKKIASKTKIIGSYHNFDYMPDLDMIDLSSPYFSYKKIAVKVKSSLETLKLLLYMKKHPQTVAIAMGEMGQPSRVLGKIFGAPFIYTCLDRPLQDTGQLTLQECIDIYHIDQMTSQTKIYALMGDPVCYSQGHLWHNQRGKNSVYVKFLVRSKEVHSFLNLALQIPIEGLSVTMPLKTIAPTPINTLYRKKEGYFWDNTDAIAVANAIEERRGIQNQDVLILGSGGSAIATAIEMRQRGARVKIYARSFKKIAHLGFSFVEKVQDYDILIHATPVGMSPKVEESIVLESQILQRSLIVEFVSHPVQTKLLQLAKKKQCLCIDGREIFERQAELQREIWTQEF